MSGPKVSDYELERHRQEQLRLKYEEEQRRIQEHLRQQREFHEELLKSIQQIEHLFKEVSASFEKLKQDTRCCISESAVKHLYGQTASAIRHCLEVQNKAEILPNEYNECLREIEQYVCAWMKKEQDFASERMTLESDSFIKSMETFSNNQQVSKCRKNTLPDKDTIQKASDEYSMCMAFLNKSLIELPEKEAQIHKMREYLSYTIMELSGTPDENLRLIKYKYTEFSHQISLWKQEQEKKNASDLKREEWMRLYRYYCTELGLHLMSAEQLAAKSETELELLCATLNNKLYLMYEENYIYQCIEEAMEDLGYQRYGHANNGVKGQFLYRMHGDTMVHVSCSDNGMISMEIGVASNETERVLDIQEVQELVQDMNTFCTDYAAIHDKLASQGVILRNSILCPPSAEYAHTFDYSQYTVECENTLNAESTQAQYLEVEDGA